MHTSCNPCIHKGGYCGWPDWLGDVILATACLSLTSTGESFAEVSEGGNACPRDVHLGSIAGSANQCSPAITHTRAGGEPVKSLRSLIPIIRQGGRQAGREGRRRGGAEDSREGGGCGDLQMCSSLRRPQGLSSPSSSTTIPDVPSKSMAARPCYYQLSTNF